MGPREGQRTVEANLQVNIPGTCLRHNIGREGLLLMMTSSNGNIFRVTGPLCGEFPFTKASDAEL